MKKLLLTVAIFFFASIPVEAAIAFVREATNGAAASPLTVTIVAPAAGNTLIAAISGDTGITSVSSVTGGGVTWSEYGAAGGRAFLWVGLNSSGSGTTITITFNASDNCSANISEWSGIATSAATDGAAVTNTGTSTAPATGSYTSTNANDLIFACGGNPDSVPTVQPGAPWTNLTTASVGASSKAYAAYQIVSATNTFSTSWTIPSALSWGTVIGGLKQAAGGAAAAGTDKRRKLEILDDPR